jgi:hypothetical protein
LIPSASFPLTAFEEITASFSKRYRSFFLAFSSSFIHSAIISQAPSRASSTLFTSSFRNPAAFPAGSASFCSKMSPASGSSPFSFAIVARVRRFGLKGS